MDTKLSVAAEGRRRGPYQRHSLEFKRSVVEETLLPGASVDNAYGRAVAPPESRLTMAKVTPLAHARLLRPLLQLKIELAWIEPPVWRRVVGPANITLGKLHQVIQAAMGWTNRHLHEFEIAECRFNLPDPDWPDDTVSEKRVTLAGALAGKKTFRYVYDFGDDWEHRIKVEKVLSSDDRLRHPLCLDGANACPPEDVGGTPGYEDLRQALADPDHPERDDMLIWLGGEFDPAAFDLARANQRLQRIKL